MSFSKNYARPSSTNASSDELKKISAVTNKYYWTDLYSRRGDLKTRNMSLETLDVLCSVASKMSNREAQWPTYSLDNSPDMTL